MSKLVQLVLNSKPIPVIASTQIVQIVSLASKSFQAVLFSGFEEF
jgi:hypothetical protein